MESLLLRGLATETDWRVLDSFVRLIGDNGWRRIKLSDVITLANMNCAEEDKLLTRNSALNSLNKLLENDFIIRRNIKGYDRLYEYNLLVKSFPFINKQGS